MSGNTLRRLASTAGIAALAATSIMVGGSASAESPSDVGAMTLHHTWSCSVPGGYTWSQVRQASSCGFEYYLLDGVTYNLTGQWACNPPTGYTFTQSRTGSNCAVSSGQSPYEYRLAKL